jgi:hypothetical protein
MTTGVRRGCGTRISGGSYIESRLGVHGKPLEDFLFDPPVPEKQRLGDSDPGFTTIDLAALGITAVGVHLVDDPEAGVTHVFDWVGEAHYPNVWDFLHEVKTLGLSRRAELGAEDYRRLQPGSNIYLIHPRGWIRDHRTYRTAIGAEQERLTGQQQWACPQGKVEHDNSGDGHCAGLWTHDIDKGQHLTEDDPRRVRREIPSGAYYGWSRPEGVKVGYVPALVAWLPITNLAVVVDRESDKHEQALDRTSNSGLTVELVEE